MATRPSAHQGCVVVEFHADEVPVCVAVEIVKHDAAKSAVLHVEDGVAGHLRVSSAAKNEIYI